MGAGAAYAQTAAVEDLHAQSIVEQALKSKVEEAIATQLDRKTFNVHVEAVLKVRKASTERQTAPNSVRSQRRQLIRREQDDSWLVSSDIVPATGRKAGVRAVLAACAGNWRERVA